jgi:Trk K+ transport system NAD-binding subunit
VLVLEGDATDEDLLTEENVGDMDLFIALTGDDEDNILSSMLAKRLGVRRVIALINRRIYAEMMQGSTIDIALSPSQTIIGELLTHVRRGDVAAVHSLRRGAAEAIEGVARGDARTSRLVGRRIEQIELPKGARIGGVVRDTGGVCELLMPYHDLMIRTGDHVIIFHSRQAHAAGGGKAVSGQRHVFLTDHGFYCPCSECAGACAGGLCLHVSDTPGVGLDAGPTDSAQRLVGVNGHHGWTGFFAVAYHHGLPPGVAAP